MLVKQTTVAVCQVAMCHEYQILSFKSGLSVVLSDNNYAFDMQLGSSVREM